ncbi:PucR family transcriptional regulator [Microlunatus flavus]|uniref:PucR C-terminal helix-turn-helix domain-containing protein n=1 Tax=Microlunatus flavus TaxID=1036181 RepID=A0A1H9ML95_9ACTN|nr:PucR family transcriptional regulator [Microlunatus flavus]SER24237.1 PucR C-terminal helix-turn-helix domain-containing protein [Microlunatus flavus]
MDTTVEAAPEPDGHDDVQHAVDRLAARLDLSVLVEDERERPVWWATRGPVDGTRVRTILNRRVDAEVARAVRSFDLARAVAPVRTPGIPELDMWARWVMPVHAGDQLLGLLWVLDPDERVTPDDFAAIVACAERAAEVLARVEVSRRDVARRRDQLLRLLLGGPDPEAARDLLRLERLPPDARVQVDAGTRRGGWTLPDGLRVHVAGARPQPATSGAPLPVAELAEAVRRAIVTQAALRAGARLSPPSWDALGAWRLVVEAPDDLRVATVHPAAETLARLPRPELMSTARTVLDLGGDVAAAAEQLHVHRTTLYYRLDRVEELTGVDLRDGRTRTDLQLALWLAAYRAAR